MEVLSDLWPFALVAVLAVGLFAYSRRNPSYEESSGPQRPTQAPDDVGGSTGDGDD